MDERKSNVEDVDMDEFSFDCADEVIEAAAGAGRYATGALTLSFCSGLDTCPA